MVLTLGQVPRAIVAIHGKEPDHVSIDRSTIDDTPTYPNGTPLVVTVTDDGSDVDDELGCVVPITQIDPSRVMVEVTQVQNTFKMMRDSGYDTM